MSRRWLRIPLAACLMGVVSSVAVAWAAASWSDRGQWTARDIGSWVWDAPVGADDGPLIASRVGWAVVEREASGSVWSGKNHHTHVQYELRAGWPWPSLSRQIDRQADDGVSYEDPPQSLAEGLSLGAIGESISVPNGRYMPVVPLAGCIASAAAHAGLWLVVIFATRVVVGPVIICACSSEARKRFHANWAEDFEECVKPRRRDALALVLMLAPASKAGWRPRGRTLVVWCLLGVVGTVAFAWLAAVVVDPRPVDRSGIYTWETKHEQQSQPRMIEGAQVELAFVGFGIARYEVLGSSWSGTSSYEWTEVGWPCSALQYRLRQMGGVTPGSGLRSGVVLKQSSGLADTLLTREWRLPIRPLWKGLAFDVLAWGGIAAAASVPIWLVLAVRRVRTRRCPWCAYPMGTRPMCSECGSPLTRHSDRGDGQVLLPKEPPPT